jgi:hypothetical protein
MGATWKRLTFTSGAHPIPGKHALYINRFTNSFPEEMKDQLGKAQSRAGDVPNTHGGAAFIVKVQLNSSTAGSPASPLIEEWNGGPQNPVLDGSSMLIYDRQRMFEVWVSKKTVDNECFEDVAEVVREKGYRGLKVFCWAIRTGEWTVDLCLDHLPEWQRW